MPREADVSRCLGLSCKGRSPRYKSQATPYDMAVWTKLVAGTVCDWYSNCGETRGHYPDEGGVSVHAIILKSNSQRLIIQFTVVPDARAIKRRSECLKSLVMLQSTEHPRLKRGWRGSARACRAASHNILHHRKAGEQIRKHGSSPSNVERSGVNRCSSHCCSSCDCVRVVFSLSSVTTRCS